MFPMTMTRTHLVEERRFVTVLFADIVGFTTLSERLDPEDVRELSASVLARLAEAVALYGGTIDKFMGDAIMALFGAPIAHEDDPVRAVHAALAMHQAVSALAPARPRRQRAGAAAADRDQQRRGDRRRARRRRPPRVLGVRRRGEHGRPPPDGCRARAGSCSARRRRGQAGSVFDIAAVEPLVLKGKAQPVPAYEVRGSLTRDVPVLAGSGVSRKASDGRAADGAAGAAPTASGPLTRARPARRRSSASTASGRAGCWRRSASMARSLACAGSRSMAPSHAQGLSYRLIREIVTRLLGSAAG